MASEIPLRKSNLGQRGISLMGQNMPNHQGHHTTPSQIFSKTSLNQDINGNNLGKIFFHLIICRSGLHFYFRPFSS